ncbi:unnamed protein product [Urochloa decumbens]|uniref:HTH myb-type domain-containing protein n=1 Tax=Urochloa decumbens TaxID=240449 RepID=A0ABC8ZZC3_9POAL
MMARKEDHQQQHHHLRALAARAVTDSLRQAASRSTAAERAARFEDCVRSLEAEKAKMEVFRRELPISVHLVADVIEWLKEELAQQRRPAPATELFAPVATAPAAAAAAKRKAAAEGAAVKAEADANEKRSWMSSAQLWSCGSHDGDSTATTNGGGGAVAKPAQHKVSDGAFMPLSCGLPALARSPEDGAAKKPAALPVPDLTLSSPAIDAACPAAALSATSSAVTDGGAAAQRQHHHQQQQAQQQRKARRCWSPELHRRFVAALQRLGGAQVATPKQIRELMKVDGLTNDEVKSHLQKYRLHTRRASSSDGGGAGDHLAAARGGHVVRGGAGGAGAAGVLHGVAAQHVAVGVAAGAPAAGDGV